MATSDYLEEQSETDEQTAHQPMNLSISNRSFGKKGEH